MTLVLASETSPSSLEGRIEKGRRLLKFKPSDDGIVDTKAESTPRMHICK